MGAQHALQHFASALERCRPLNQEESDMLATVLSRGKSSRSFWTAADDRRLLRMRRTMLAPEIAGKMGKTVRSVQSRLHKLRRKEMGR